MNNNTKKMFKMLIISLFSIFCLMYFFMLLIFIFSLEYGIDIGNTALVGWGNIFSILVYVVFIESIIFRELKIYTILFRHKNSVLIPMEYKLNDIRRQIKDVLKILNNNFWIYVSNSFNIQRHINQEMNGNNVYNHKDNILLHYIISYEQLKIIYLNNEMDKDEYLRLRYLFVTNIKNIIMILPEYKRCIKMIAKNGSELLASDIDDLMHSQNFSKKPKKEY